MTVTVPLHFEIEWPGLLEKTYEYPSGLQFQDPYQSGPQHNSGVNHTIHT